MFVEVNGDGQDALDRAMKEFKRKIKKEGLLQDIKKREFYLKPSKRKKLRHIEALKRKRRDEREQQNQRVNTTLNHTRRDIKSY